MKLFKGQKLSPWFSGLFWFFTEPQPDTRNHMITGFHLPAVVPYWKMTPNSNTHTHTHSYIANMKLVSTQYDEGLEIIFKWCKTNFTSLNFKLIQSCLNWLIWNWAQINLKPVSNYMKLKWNWCQTGFKPTLGSAQMSIVSPFKKRNLWSVLRGSIRSMCWSCAV